LRTEKSLKNKKMIKTQKIIWWVVGIVVVVGIVWWGVSRNGGSGNMIKVGVMVPLTGDAASMGEPLVKVFNLAADEINTSGGINGKQIQLLIEDSKCTGTDGANAAQKLINVDGVQAIIGGLCSGETLPAVPIAAQAKVLLFSASASSPKLTNISPYFFRDYPSDSAGGKVLADGSYNMKHWRTVAVMQEQTDYAVGLYGAFSDEFQKLGGTVLNQSFPSTATDFRSFLTTLKAQNPDALYMDTQTPQVADRILQQLHQLGWKIPLLVNDVTSGDPTVMKADAVTLDGAFTTEFSTNPNNPKFEHLLEAYKAKYGTDVPYQGYAQTMYDAVYLLADGIKAVGYNGAALAQWSRTIKDWQGASDNITIEPSGDRASGSSLEIIHNGVMQQPSNSFWINDFNAPFRAGRWNFYRRFLIFRFSPIIVRINRYFH
jgi:branched-chain amino acid transport system substrate-binding protein